VAITSEDSFYILRFDRDAYTARLDSGELIGDEGVEEAFELIAEISEPCVTYALRNRTNVSSVKTAKWIGDCLIYTNATNRLNYLIGDQVHTVNHFDQYVRAARLPADCLETCTYLATFPPTTAFMLPTRT
jgi:coatomer subunit beta'